MCLPEVPERIERRIVVRAGQALDVEAIALLAALDHALGFFRLRARLNYGEISSLGPKGFITFVLVALALAWLFVWGLRSSSLSPILRAGVAGVAAAGMAALVVEDSGFLTAGIYLLYPALGFATGYADRALLGANLSGTPSPQEPPHDAGDQDHGNHGARQRE